MTLVAEKPKGYWPKVETDMLTQEGTPPTKPPLTKWTDEAGDFGWDDLKLKLEAAIYNLLPPGHNAVFRLLTDLAWYGGCPSPGAIALSKNQTTHQEDISQVCFDCYGLHILPRDYPKITDKVILQLAEWVVTNHLRILAGHH